MGSVPADPNGRGCQRRWGLSPPGTRRFPAARRRASVDVLDGVRGRELMALDETRDDGVHPWDAQGVERHRESDQDVDRPDMRMVEGRVQGEAVPGARPRRVPVARGGAAVGRVGSPAGPALGVEGAVGGEGDFAA